MKRLVLALTVAAAALSASPAWAGQEKVTLCHWANGHPHTITVAAPAAGTHLIWHVETGWQPAPGHEKDTIGTCPSPTTTITGPIELEVIEITTTTTSTTPAPTTTSTTGPASPTTTVTIPDGETGSPSTATTPSTPTSPTSSPTPMTELPRTGTSVLGLVLGGLALVILGVAARVLGRR